MIHRRAGRRGNAVIEAALVLPVLLLLGFGMVEFGHLFYVKNNLQGAARDGVRKAILDGATNSSVNTAIAEAMSVYGLSKSGYTVTTNPANVSQAAAGTNITVTVQCNWGKVGVRPMGLIAENKVIKAVAVMRKEEE